MLSPQQAYNNIPPDIYDMAARYELGIPIKVHQRRSIQRRAARTKLYICTEGLLMLYKKEEKAIRWSYVKEFYTTLGCVTRLVMTDGSSLNLPLLLIGGYKSTINRTILVELVRRLLAETQARYARGEEVSFGDLKVAMHGISFRKKQILWHNLGTIDLEKEKLSAYYLKPNGSNTKYVGNVHARNVKGKWYSWQKQYSPKKSLPNLLVFVALVNSILDQQVSQPMGQVPSVMFPLSFTDRVALLKSKNKRRRHIAITSIFVLAMCLYCVFGYFILQHENPPKQTENTNAQSVSSDISQLAHKSYYARVPGRQCDHGKAVWLNGGTLNDYDCLHNGLLITQKNFQYSVDEYFSFSYYSDKDQYRQNIFATHYRVQVNATFVSENSSICVELGVHIQSSLGRQMFDVCVDGTWHYSSCSSGCATFEQITKGYFSYKKSTYLIAVDVTSTTLKLLIDNQVIATVHDKTYSSTDLLDLAVWGDQIEGKPVMVRFSDFLYTPYP